MKLLFSSTFLFIYILVFAQQKKVCITIDDLPAVTNGIEGNEIRWQITNGIVKTLRSFDAKAIGYVNEGKLNQNGKLDNERVQMLEKWLQFGQDLGNHTYSHPSYHRQSFKDYTRNISNGERIIKPLAKKYGKEIKYYRHPYLHIGTDQSKADSLKAFLMTKGYIEAPVTIDTDDYLFAAAYTRAFRKQDQNLMEKIGSDYLKYMEEKVVFYDQISKELYGRYINQTLLIHANLLNSEYLDELLEIFQNHSYSFVSQEEILEDEIYNQPITVFGDYGISWIKRWALSAGIDYSFFKDDPKVPDYIK